MTVPDCSPPFRAPHWGAAASPHAGIGAAATAVRLALGAPRMDDAGVDWPTVLRVAGQELVAPLAWTRARLFIQEHADADIAAAWRRTAVAAHLHGQRQLESLRQTLTALESRHLDPVVLKGLPLGEQLYGDTFVRSSSDIDLYVPASQREAASVVLATLDWRRSEGAAPWHEAWSRRRGESEEHLELHSLLVSDHLAHLPAPRAVTTYRHVAGELVPALDGPFLPAYLAVHLATHQMPPLLWVIDFATLWSRLSHAERTRAVRAGETARVGRYLAWAQRCADAIQGVREGDDRALESLGFATDGRRDAHSIVRHLRLAETAADRLRVFSAFAVPHRTRGSIGSLVRYSIARLRTRLAALAGAHRTYVPGPPHATAPEPTHVAPARPLRVERSEMVSLVRDVVDAGGALRVRAPGGSMLPTIPRGALVRIRGVPVRGIERGDIVLALTADGEPVLHRVSAVNGETLTTRGDAALAADPPTPVSRVIGIATHVSYLGNEHELPRRAPRSLRVTAMKLRRRLARAVRGGG